MPKEFFDGSPNRAPDPNLVMRPKRVASGFATNKSRGGRIMGVKTVKSVWGFDPRWVRVEQLSDDDELLGVEFERSGDIVSSKKPTRRQSVRQRLWMIWSLAVIASGMIALATIAWAR
jgi:hypothetical protein